MKNQMHFVCILVTREITCERRR